MGRAKGQRWIYPEGTDIRLRALHRLQECGLRGDALAFSLWWIRRGELSLPARRYALSNQTILKSRLQRRIAAKVNESMRAEEAEAGAPGEPIDPTSPEALSMWLGATTPKGPLYAMVVEGLQTLVPGARIQAQDLEPFLGAYAAATMGFTVEEVDGVPGDLWDIVRYSLGLPASYSGGFVQTMLRLYESPALVAAIYARITDGDAAAFNRARRLIKRNGFLRSALRWMVGDEIASQAKMSRRKRLRQGPWRRPQSAYRAALLGIFLGLESVVEQIGARAQLDEIAGY